MTESWRSERLTYREPSARDVPMLAAMNRQLIIDEGHNNPMSGKELQSRMRHWLESHEYEGTLISHGRTCVGYALWQRQEYCLYVRHFYIAPEFRRRGFGREAMDWMRRHVWRDRSRIRLEVLVTNTRGLGFWHALGFHDYCVTMELTEPSPE